MRDYHLPEDEIERLLLQERKKDFSVWADNWPALQVFIACQTQWRVIVGATQCIYQGLDYSSLESVLRIQAPRKKRADLFEDVRLLEQGALAKLNAKT